jgi:RimJ/RimL family protein N-acetyltransferase
MLDITGKYVSLELVRPQHIPQIISWSAASRDGYFLLESTLPMSTDRLALEIADPKRQLFILKDVKNKYQGLLKIFNLDTTHRHGHLQWTMQPSKNNTKLVTEAVQLAIQNLTSKQDLNIFYTMCLPHELEFKKVLSTVGYKRSGTFKDHIFMRNAYVPVEIYSFNLKEKS